MNWSGRNVLITGGAGHIGSHLTAELVKLGASVRVADNLWRGKKEYLLDENGNVLGQSSGLPLFLGNLEVCVKGTAEMFGWNHFKPGDIFFVNDSLTIFVSITSAVGIKNFLDFLSSSFNSN